MNYAIYGFVDVPEEGFGLTFLNGDKGTRYCNGVWGRSVEGRSSSYREFENAMDALEVEADQG
eukprot:1181450-Ditylum_brightwellii.AAC.1